MSAAFSAKPLWDDVPLPSFPGLKKSAEVDVVVVGAGLTGITAAYLLKQAGCRVALLDRRSVGGTDTGCTSAHLTVVVDQDLLSLAETFGEDHARAVWDAGFAAIDQIDSLVQELGIDCEFSWVPGFRHVPFDGDGPSAEADRKKLDAEAALANAIGFDVTPVDRTPLVDRPGWRIENQAVFHPRKYLRRLLEAIPGDGSFVCENSEAAFDASSGECEVDGHRIKAPHVVVATHNPIVGRSSQAAAALLQTRLALYTSYVVSSPLPDDDALRGCYWDTSSPYRYIRVDRGDDGPRLIAGGEDHKTGQASDTREAYAALERWLRKLVPGVDLQHRWSGQVIETNDGLPLIGDVGANQFIATGYAGNGMTFGTLSAMMARDAITRRTNPWTALFGPDRWALRHKPWDYLRENADYPYYLVRDRFAGAQSRTFRSVLRGTGKLVEHDGQIVAAYRDERGKLTTLSAICTHLGCRVGWNTAEQTWDCPCHGSRFSSTGEVLAGPQKRRWRNSTWRPQTDDRKPRAHRSELRTRWRLSGSSSSAHHQAASTHSARWSAALPPHFPAPICIVLHTAPDSPGMLAQILSRAGPLPVGIATNGMRLEESRIYVAPPDHHLLIEPGGLHVSKGPTENRFRPAIDPLFRSAAQVYGPAAIGVVLTGNLDDGTAGLWAIKRLGGIAIVQDPGDALFPSMPLSALRHVDVEYTLPVADIAAASCTPRRGADRGA